MGEKMLTIGTMSKTDIKDYLENLNLKVELKNLNVKVSDVIYETTDLTIFKFMEEGNRPIDWDHVKQLKERMGEKFLRTIIIVNKFMEIIEGQHRYSAIKKINEENRVKGLPLISIEFVVCEDYGVEECCEYNGKGKNWTNKNITEGGKILKIEEYKIYDEFVKKYNLPHNVTIGLLTGETTNAKNSYEFKNLKLKIVDINSSLDKANKIVEIVNTGVIPIGKSDQPISVFGLALLDVFNVEGYDHNRMVSKCKEYVQRENKSLRRLTNITEPLIEFEDIYNHKEKSKTLFISEKKKNAYLFKQMRK
jgi:hypothetical protein